MDGKINRALIGINIGKKIKIEGENFSHTGTVSRIDSYGIKIDCEDGLTVGVSSKDLRKYRIIRL